MTSFSDEPSASEYISFANVGNSCHMSSALQLMFSISEIFTGLINISHEKFDTFVRNVEISSANDVVYELIRCLRAAKSRKFSNPDIPSQKIIIKLTPRSLYTSLVLFSPSFKFGQQEDADEVIMSFFRAIENSEFTRDFWKHEIEPKLQFKCITTFTCTGCKHSFKKSINQIKLSLNIGETTNSIIDISSIIDTMQKPDTIDDYNCDKCKKTIKYTREDSYSNGSNYVLIHINRFIDETQKNMQKLNIPEILMFANRAYSIKTIVNHLGRTANGGHYTTSVYPKFVIDDDEVREYNEYAQIMASMACYIALYEVADRRQPRPGLCPGPV